MLCDWLLLLYVTWLQEYTSSLRLTLPLRPRICLPWAQRQMSTPRQKTSLSPIYLSGGSAANERDLYNDGGWGKTPASGAVTLISISGATECRRLTKHALSQRGEWETEGRRRVFAKRGGGASPQPALHQTPGEMPPLWDRFCSPCDYWDV